MDPTRRISLIAGVFFLITFVASIPAAFYCKLPKGRYRFYVAGADRAGNVAEKPGANILAVH